MAEAQVGRRWASRLEGRCIHGSIQFPSFLLVVGGLVHDTLVSPVEMASKWERKSQLVTVKRAIDFWWEDRHTSKHSIVKSSYVYVTHVFTPQHTHTQTHRLALIFFSIFESRSCFCSLFGGKEKDS